MDQLAPLFVDCFGTSEGFKDVDWIRVDWGSMDWDRCLRRLFLFSLLCTLVMIQWLYKRM